MAIGRHGRLRGLLSSYVDGQVSPRQSRQVEEHLSGCDECRAELESLRATVALLQALPQLDLPRSFALASPPMPARARPTYFWATGLATSVAALLLVAVVVAEVFEVIAQPEAVQFTAAAVPETLFGAPEAAAAIAAPRASVAEEAAPAVPAPALALLEPTAVTAARLAPSPLPSPAIAAAAPRAAADAAPPSGLVAAAAPATPSPGPPAEPVAVPAAALRAAAPLAAPPPPSSQTPAAATAETLAAAPLAPAAVATPGPAPTPQPRQMAFGASVAESPTPTPQPTTEKTGQDIAGAVEAATPAVAPQLAAASRTSDEVRVVVEGETAIRLEASPTPAPVAALVATPAPTPPLPVPELAAPAVTRAVEPPAPMPSPSGSAPQAAAPAGDETRLPLRELEIALGAVVALLLAATVWLAARRRRL